MKPFKIFVVEDDPWYAKLVQHHLSLNPEYEVEVYHSGQEVLNNLYKNPGLITVDYTLPDTNGSDLLKKIRQQHDIKVIVISGQEDVNTAIDLLKQGAYDYIVKDNDMKDRLWNAVKNIREKVILKDEISQLKEEITRKYSFDNFLKGNSDQMNKVYSLIEKSSQTNINVSITGETGTGKELVAKAIHYNSPRANKNFVAVNVAAIPKDLIESELFGHEKGAFTGAISRRIGKFEEAEEGTIFLDEIGEMDVNLQAKLLRVLQEREVFRVGGNEQVKINVRVIVATHKNLSELVLNGEFREDLYYRILGLPIDLPPLRERGNDIILLAKHFLDLFCKENNFPSKKFDQSAKEKFLTFTYPGNVRELKAVVELSAVMSNDDMITAENIVFNTVNPSTSFLVEETSLKEYNNKIIKHFLDKYNNSVIKVAEKLDIGKSTIYRMLKEEKEGEEFMFIK